MTNAQSQRQLLFAKIRFGMKRDYYHIVSAERTDKAYVICSRVLPNPKYRYPKYVGPRDICHQCLRRLSELRQMGIHAWPTTGVLA